MNLKSVVSNFQEKKNVPKNFAFVCLFFVPCFVFFLIWHFYVFHYLSHLRAVKIWLCFLKIKRQWRIRITFSRGGLSHSYFQEFNRYFLIDFDLEKKI